MSSSTSKGRGGAGRRRPLIGVLAGILVAATAAAANTGFQHAVNFVASPAPSLHWLALPYRYLPADVGTPQVVDAEDFCEDLEGDGVAAVVRWDEASSTFGEHLCGDPMPFPLSEGTGYGVRILPDYSIHASVAGGHDDDFAYSIPATGGSQLSWLSIPYHIRNPGNYDPVTAAGLCQQIGASEVAAIVRWNPTSGAYEAYGCGSAFEAPFEIVRGEAYGVVNRPGTTLDWQPLHF